MVTVSWEHIAGLFAFTSVPYTPLTPRLVYNMSFRKAAARLGFSLANGCRITHGQGANVKKPFSNIPVEMHELDAGDAPGTGKAYCGQVGFIPFDESLRLPRHVHVGILRDEGKNIFVAERILVLNGVALVELCGKVYVVAPGTLVTIGPGVPHTWTACPPGVKLPDGESSDGKFLMVYEYEEPTGFFPTATTETMNSVDEYQKFEYNLEDIRFPKLTRDEIVETAAFVWDRELRNDLAK